MGATRSSSPSPPISHTARSSAGSCAFERAHGGAASALCPLHPPLKYHETVLNRRTSGSVVCPSCGSLVGVRDDKCYTCGRAHPGLWGFGPALRRLGADFGFGPTVVGACVTLWVVSLLMSGGNIRTGN